MYRTVKRRTTAALLLLAAVLCGAARPVDVPLDIQVPLLLRVLSYDRALGRHGGNEVVLAVLYDAANDASVRSRAAFTRAVRSGDITAVNGRGLRVVEINVSAGSVAASLRSAGASAAYLTPGLAPRLPALVQAGAESRVLLMCGSEDYVRAGVGVGIGSSGGKPQLLINLRSARASGADLPAPLLNVATVIQ